MNYWVFHLDFIQLQTNIILRILSKNKNKILLFNLLLYWIKLNKYPWNWSLDKKSDVRMLFPVNVCLKNRWKVEVVSQREYWLKDIFIIESNGFDFAQEISLLVISVLNHWIRFDIFSNDILSLIKTKSFFRQYKITILCRQANREDESPAELNQSHHLDSRVRMFPLILLWEVNNEWNPALHFLTNIRTKTKTKVKLTIATKNTKSSIWTPSSGKYPRLSLKVIYFDLKENNFRFQQNIENNGIVRRKWIKRSVSHEMSFIWIIMWRPSG